MTLDKARWFLCAQEAQSIRQLCQEMGKQMILSTIRMVIPPKKRDDALRILRLLTEQCRDHLGCHSCRIYGDLQKKNVLMFEEIWRNEEDLELHICSDDYLKLLLVVEMSLKQPEIRFDTISSSTGIETIEKARGHAR